MILFPQQLVGFLVLVDHSLLTMKNQLIACLAPQVDDTSGGCGTMFSINVVSEHFRWDQRLYVDCARLLTVDAFCVDILLVYSIVLGMMLWVLEWY